MSRCCEVLEAKSGPELRAPLHPVELGLEGNAFEGQMALEST